MGQSLDAIFSIGIAKMCSCTSCSTYCTRFCSNRAFSIATETCAVGTARGAAAHFRDTNRYYSIRRLSHQSFKSILYQDIYLQSFEVGICLKPHITTKICNFRRTCEKCVVSTIYQLQTTANTWSDIISIWNFGGTISGCHSFDWYRGNVHLHLLQYLLHTFL